jgi:metal-dependent amidase/aminoacylase/carboxypeptidase family protein
MASLTDLAPVGIRRDLHAHPEVGWTEFRTTALVAETLDDRGFTLYAGADALDVDERLGTPPRTISRVPASVPAPRAHLRSTSTGWRRAPAWSPRRPTGTGRSSGSGSMSTRSN